MRYFNRYYIIFFSLILLGYILDSINCNLIDEFCINNNITRAELEEEATLAGVNIEKFIEIMMVQAEESSNDSKDTFSELFIKQRFATNNEDNITTTNIQESNTNYTEKELVDNKVTNTVKQLEDSFSDDMKSKYIKSMNSSEESDIKKTVKMLPQNTLQQVHTNNSPVGTQLNKQTSHPKVINQEILKPTIIESKIKPLNIKDTGYKFKRVYINDENKLKDKLKIHFKNNENVKYVLVDEGIEELFRVKPRKRSKKTIIRKPKENPLFVEEIYKIQVPKEVIQLPPQKRIIYPPIPKFPIPNQVLPQQQIIQPDNNISKPQTYQNSIFGPVFVAACAAILVIICIISGLCFCGISRSSPQVIKEFRPQSQQTTVPARLLQPYQPQLVGYAILPNIN
ncbi:uncharacterized protein CMU_007110 [Cryptosporidium muris RN66]|uniref:Transmembrane protein n=1 Tax=Cryptosporidium muris (strain RN66) TaxID=441375 RepID=B6ADD1_CRYMR|nr:uncharacterized protein CMU_007110 [Cryptosporidium muris RN66]EEA06222.1 hypothetical protein, conserved [Cryptosporidium muris RN66]|eukprot:XP_002140571.1 hypothetical protein [Cryptosporidium muris RN66]